VILHFTPSRVCLLQPLHTSSFFLCSTNLKKTQWFYLRNVLTMIPFDSAVYTTTIPLMSLFSTIPYGNLVPALVYFPHCSVFTLIFLVVYNRGPRARPMKGNVLFQLMWGIVYRYEKHVANKGDIKMHRDLSNLWEENTWETRMKMVG
jgi:hypothetical protein